MSVPSSSPSTGRRLHAAEDHGKPGEERGAMLDEKPERRGRHGNDEVDLLPRILAAEQGRQALLVCLARRPGEVEQLRVELDRHPPRPPAASRGCPRPRCSAPAAAPRPRTPAGPPSDPGPGRPRGRRTGPPVASRRVGGRPTETSRAASTGHHAATGRPGPPVSRCQLIEKERDPGAEVLLARARRPPCDDLRSAPSDQGVAVLAEEFVPHSPPPGARGSTSPRALA